MHDGSGTECLPDASYIILCGASDNAGGASLLAQPERICLQCWRCGVQSLGREDPLEEKWQPTPVFLPGKSHGSRSLAGSLEEKWQFKQVCVCVCVFIASFHMPMSCVYKFMQFCEFTPQVLSK